MISVSDFMFCKRLCFHCHFPFCGAANAMPQRNIALPKHGSIVLYSNIRIIGCVVFSKAVVAPDVIWQMSKSRLDDRDPRG